MEDELWMGDLFKDLEAKEDWNENPIVDVNFGTIEPLDIGSQNIFAGLEEDIFIPQETKNNDIIIPQEIKNNDIIIPQEIKNNDIVIPQEIKNNDIIIQPQEEYIPEKVQEVGEQPRKSPRKRKTTVLADDIDYDDDDDEYIDEDHEDEQKKKRVQIKCASLQQRVQSKRRKENVGKDQERKKELENFLEMVKASDSGETKQKNTKKKLFTCTYEGCGRQFLWKWAMEEHAHQHMPDIGRVHQCTFCDKAFFTVGCLKSHMRIHTRKPYSYVCKYEGCTKKYCTSEGLRLHTRNVHEADKKWKCPQDGCKKSFVRQSDLRLHIIRIHSAERPYPCTTPGCSKSFACYSELKRHLTSHRAKKAKKNNK